MCTENYFRSHFAIPSPTPSALHLLFLIHSCLLPYFTMYNNSFLIRYIRKHLFTFLYLCLHIFLWLFFGLSSSYITSSSSSANGLCIETIFPTFMSYIYENFTPSMVFSWTLFTTYNVLLFYTRKNLFFSFYYSLYRFLIIICHALAFFLYFAYVILFYVCVLAALNRIFFVFLRYLLKHFYSINFLSNLAVFLHTNERDMRCNNKQILLLDWITVVLVFIHKNSHNHSQNSQ
jgi:hypothetical protein